MEKKSTPWIKIAAFILVGIVFSGAMVGYSNTRKAANLTGDFTDIIESLSDSEKSSPDKHFEKIIPQKSGGTFRLESDCGEVFIEAQESEQVNISVDISGTSRRVERFVVDFIEKDNEVVVRGRTNDNHGFSWASGNLSVVYKIRVPKQTKVIGSTAGGDVAIAGVQGEIKFETSGGNIGLKGNQGASDVSTSGGDVSAEENKGNVRARTSGGDVQCMKITGDVEASTSGGNVAVETVDGKVDAKTSGGNVSVIMRGENRGIEAGTSGGSISITLPENIKADLRASATGGRVKCEIPLTVEGEVDESELNGKINGGGLPIRAETSGGNIKILKLKK